VGREDGTVTVLDAKLKVVKTFDKHNVEIPIPARRP
jgi:hypothetical protein